MKKMFHEVLVDVARFLRLFTSIKMIELLKILPAFLFFVLACSDEMMPVNGINTFTEIQQLITESTSSEIGVTYAKRSNAPTTSISVPSTSQYNVAAIFSDHYTADNAGGGFRLRDIVLPSTETYNETHELIKINGSSTISFRPEVYAETVDFNTLELHYWKTDTNKIRIDLLCTDEGYDWIYEESIKKTTNWVSLKIDLSVFDGLIGLENITGIKIESEGEFYVDELYFTAMERDTPLSKGFKREKIATEEEAQSLSVGYSQYNVAGIFSDTYTSDNAGAGFRVKDIDIEGISENLNEFIQNGDNKILKITQDQLIRFGTESYGEHTPFNFVHIGYQVEKGTSFTIRLLSTDELNHWEYTERVKANKDWKSIILSLSDFNREVGIVNLKGIQVLSHGVTDIHFDEIFLLNDDANTKKSLVKKEIALPSKDIESTNPIVPIFSQYNALGIFSETYESAVDGFELTSINLEGVTTETINENEVLSLNPATPARITFKARAGGINPSFNQLVLSYWGAPDTKVKVVFSNKKGVQFKLNNVPNWYVYSIPLEKAGIDGSNLKDITSIKIEAISKEEKIIVDEIYLLSGELLINEVIGSKDSVRPSVRETSTGNQVEISKDQGSSNNQGGTNTSSNQQPSNNQGSTNTPSNQQPSNNQGGTNTPTNQQPSNNQGGTNTPSNQQPSNNQGGTNTPSNQQPSNQQTTDQNDQDQDNNEKEEEEEEIVDLTGEDTTEDNTEEEQTEITEGEEGEEDPQRQVSNNNFNVVQTAEGTIKWTGPCPAEKIAKGFTVNFDGVKWKIVNRNQLFNAIDNNDLTNIITSCVTNFGGLFFDNTSFNGDIRFWDTSKATNMSYMFNNATSFNQNISGWDTSNVTAMEWMFQNATSFNQDIGSWDVGNVTNMWFLFANAEKFNQDISGWDTSSVTNMSGMFGGASAFNQNIGGWDVSNVWTMSGMFLNATSFNQPIGNWNTGSLTSAFRMFEGATSFNQSIGSWKVDKVTNMQSMFKNATSFNKPLSTWFPKNVTDMTDMFNGASSYRWNIVNWRVPKVTKCARFAKNTSSSWLERRKPRFTKCDPKAQ